ncbi:hypothetical protein M0638_03655 [Roseomonas sp. NAR14]|uniref:Uncharacterized protein n=1 Tax=Roseomonas acroporae TaxID=2937791 RepID=A0A9X2BST4_9PROT|nr:hypothetical protein [Roseomonas acroporae]MCK8783477.1 hypothetical protein [Roseomonas acroporae]
MDASLETDDAAADLPAWMQAALDRLLWLLDGRRAPLPGREATALAALLLADLRMGGPPIDWSLIRQRFLIGCVAALARAMELREEFLPVREALRPACEAAVSALAAEAGAEEEMRMAARLAVPLAGPAAGAVGHAPLVPGRAVQADLLARSESDGAAGAMVMLIDDLAAVDLGLPVMALANAIRDERSASGAR